MKIIVAFLSFLLAIGFALAAVTMESSVSSKVMASATANGHLLRSLVETKCHNATDALYNTTILSAAYNAWETEVESANLFADESCVTVGDGGYLDASWTVAHFRHTTTWWTLASKSKALRISAHTL